MGPRALRRRRTGALAIVELFVDPGVGGNARSGTAPTDTPIFPAAANGHAGVVVVRYLLDHGAVLNFVVHGEARCNALTGAVWNGHRAVVRPLVERGADVNATGGGMTPLRYAISYGRPEIADYLRSARAVEAGVPFPPD